MKTQKKKATQLSGTVTLVQENSNTGICGFRNLLSAADIEAWTSETNKATTEKVALLEDLCHKYKVPDHAPEFKITQTEAYFEFSYTKVLKLQKELLELGAMAFNIKFSSDDWDLL